MLSVCSLLSEHSLTLLIVVHWTAVIIEETRNIDMEDLGPRPSRRQRQAAEREGKILDAAARLIAERGFHRATTREIAAAADVAEGTLYNYFATKDDLLFGILARLEEQINTAAQQSLLVESGDPRKLLIQALLQRRHFAESHSVMLQAILSEILSNAELRSRYAEQLLKPTLQSLEANLRQLVERRKLTPLDVPAAARVLAGLWVGLFFLQALEDPLVIHEWDRLSNVIAGMFFDSIAPQAVEDHPDKSSL